jgi:hypothetical protein
LVDHRRLSGPANVGVGPQVLAFVAAVLEPGAKRRLAAAAILWSGAEGHGRLIRRGSPRGSEVDRETPRPALD